MILMIVPSVHNKISNRSPFGPAASRPPQGERLEILSLYRGLFHMIVHNLNFTF